VLERISHANEETGYTIARVATDRSGTDLFTVVGSLLGVQRERHAMKQPVEQPVREPERLTDREAENLGLLPSDRAVADRAEMSPSQFTVHKHLGNIYRKFDVAGRAEPVVIARNAGLLGDEPESVADPVAEPSADDVPDLDVVGTAEQELAASKRSSRLRRPSDDTGQRRHPHHSRRLMHAPLPNQAGPMVLGVAEAES